LQFVAVFLIVRGIIGVYCFVRAVMTEYDEEMLIERPMQFKPRGTAASQVIVDDLDFDGVREFYRREIADSFKAPPSHVNCRSAINYFNHDKDRALTDEEILKTVKMFRGEDADEPRGKYRLGQLLIEFGVDYKKGSSDGNE